MIDRTLGPYRIVARLGAGGMGEVYRAHDERLHRFVAVKVLPKDVAQDAAARARFDREARAIAAANHPNICVVYDVGHADDIDYIVMELLEGEALFDTILRGPLPIDKIVDYGIALSDALATAHGRGLIHRDLKPANIFITSHDVPKILDFGLAKIAASADDTTGIAPPLTETGMAMGTLAYMSPEQLRNEPLDAGTDLFSFGLVLFEMATGDRAFDGPTGVAIAAAILGEPAPDPRARRSELPIALSQTIGKCLEKDRQLRTQSAAELKAELRRLKREWSTGTVAVAVAAPPFAPPVLPVLPSPSSPTALSSGQVGAAAAASTTAATASAAPPGSRRSRLARMLAVGAAIVVVGAIGYGYSVIRNRTAGDPPQQPTSLATEIAQVPGTTPVASPAAPPAALSSGPTVVSPSREASQPAPITSAPAPAPTSTTAADSPTTPSTSAPTPGTPVPTPAPAAAAPSGPPPVTAATNPERPPVRPVAAMPPSFNVQALPNSARASLSVISPDGKFVVYRTIVAGAHNVMGRYLATNSEFLVQAFPLDQRVFGLTVTADNSAVDIVERPVDARGALGTPELVRVPLNGSGGRVKPAANVWSLAGWSPDRKEIAYVDTEPGWSVLKVMNADGSHPRVVSRRATPLIYNMLASSSPLNRPAWSPDGKSIALVGLGRGQQVVIVNVETGKEQVIQSADVPLIDSVVWYDSERLVLTRTSSETTNHQVWVLNVRTQELTPITRDTSAYSGLSITDDGSALVSTRVTTVGSIWMNDRPGGPMTEVVTEGVVAPASVSVTSSGRVVYSAGASIWTIDRPSSPPRLVVKSGLSPILTPDGNAIVYSDVLRDRLFRVQTDGSNQRMIVNGDAREPALSPDGRTVYFTSNRNGTFSIWSVSIDGGAPRLVVDEYSFNAQVSPDGKRLLFATSMPTWKVCTLPACVDRTPTPMATKWAPDGGFAYAGSPNVWVRAQGPGSAKPITTFTERTLASFDWSPDGKRLVVTRSTTTADLVLLTLKR